MQSQTILTIWMTEILPVVFRRSARPSRVAHPARSADGLIEPARASLFIRICFLHRHHRTSGTGRLTVKDIAYLMLGPVKACLVHFVGEHVFCLGSSDGQIQPSQRLLRRDGHKLTLPFVPTGIWSCRKLAQAGPVKIDNGATPLNGNSKQPTGNDANFRIAVTRPELSR